MDDNKKVAILEKNSMVFPLLMPLAFSYISTKTFDLFRDKMADHAADRSKSVLNNVSEKIVHKRIFKERPNYLTMEQFNELIGEQTRALSSIVAEEIAKYFENAKDTNTFMAGMTTSINNSLEKALAQPEEFNKLISDSEAKIRFFGSSANPNWKEFSDEQLDVLHSLEPEKIKIALLDLKDNLEKIQYEILELRKELKEEHIETREVINQQTTTFVNYFDKIEQYLQNIVSLQLEKNITISSLGTQYHTIFNSLIICPNCGKTTNERIEDTWKCPDCNYVLTGLQTAQKTRLTESTLIALSIYNQAITIKNSRGDIQFQSKNYVPRAEVEIEFEKFLVENEKNSIKKLFVLLGEPGVGKTWAAAALSNKYTHTIPVFYFQLRFRDTEEQLKSIFLDDPKLYDLNSVFVKIKEFLSENVIMKILFVFDGVDELTEEIDQRWFFYKLLEPLSKVDRILMCITSRKYDWNENPFRLKEKQFIDEISYKKEGIYLDTYSDDEYTKIMSSLTSISPIEKWEEHWGYELKRPFLHAIVKRLALELSAEPTFITIAHPSMFELFEYRLQVTKDDHPTIVKFADAQLQGKILTRDNPEIEKNQPSIAKLLSAGIIKEQETGNSHTRWFAPLVISDPFEQAYCCYVMFMSLRLRPKDFLNEWNEFITSENVNVKTKNWIEYIVNNTELSKILSTDVPEETNSLAPNQLMANEINIKITKEISALIQIYKKRQISIVRLAQRLEIDYNDVLKLIEELLLRGKIKGKIDNKSTPEVQDDILDLAKDWHVEEELWNEQKKNVQERHDSFMKKFNEIRSHVNIGTINEAKISSDFEKIKGLLDELGNYKLSLSNINTQDYITDVSEEIITFIDSNNTFINEISQQIENITSEWEKNKENLDNQLSFELQAIDTSVQKFEKQLNSYDSFFHEMKTINTIFLMDRVNKLLRNIENISSNFNHFKDQLTHIDGQMLLKVKEQKSALENRIVQDIIKIEDVNKFANNLLDEFSNIQNQQSQELISYEGKQLNTFEYNVIKDLNTLIGISLEPIFSIKWNSIGFVVNENNEIIELSLCNLNIRSLPDSISNLRHLKSLNLRKNVFESIPEVLSSVTSLEKLFIEQNQVKELSNIYLLPNLIELYIYQNSIELLPDGLMQLKNLRYLNFNSNLISNIPENISLLKNLEVLDLYNNKISTVPVSVKKLAKLKQLFVGKNNLNEIELSKLDDMKNKEILII